MLEPSWVVTGKQADIVLVISLHAESGKCVDGGNNQAPIEWQLGMSAYYNAAIMKNMGYAFGPLLRRVQRVVRGSVLLVAEHDVGAKQPSGGFKFIQGHGTQIKYLDCQEQEARYQETHQYLLWHLDAKQPV